MAKITIILSTYNRAKSLKYAILSVLNQTYQNWLLLVIGDACNDESANIVASFQDERIFFVNLPERCGEQAGPNSAGIAAVKTDYIAFLNHDDYWLSDHLETAIKVLENNLGDFYASSAILTACKYHESDDKSDPVFAQRTPEDRDIHHAFYKSPVLFEPVSSWVMKRDLAWRVGNWCPASCIYRTPIEAWLLKIWQKSVKPIFNRGITVIYCNAEKIKWYKDPADKRKTIYQNGLNETSFWHEKLANKNRKTIDHAILSSLSEMSGRVDFFKPRFSGHKFQWFYDALVNEQTARVFKKTGWDAFEKFGELSDLQKGDQLSTMLRRRTGEELPKHQDWADQIEYVTEQLNSCPRWILKNADH